MTRKLVLVNLVCAFVLLSAAVSGVRGTLDDIRRYGWTHEETKIINGLVVSTNVVSSVAEGCSCIIIVLLGVASFANAFVLRGLTTKRGQERRAERENA